MTRTAIAAAVLALALPTIAAAEDPPRRHENRRDRRALHDDFRDAKIMEQLLRDFERTWAALDRAGVRNVELRTQALLEEEAREAAREAREAARELRRDRREARDDRWDDRREDRRELADDRRDLIQEREYREKVEALRAEWGRLRDQRVFPAMMRKHAVLQELLQLAHMEIRSDADELREDQR